jgi:uncharacterized protein (DUF302 family)
MHKRAHTTSTQSGKERVLMATYGMDITVTGSIDEVKARLQEALKAQGFGILTEIDVRQTLKRKLGVDFRPYLILGACNPPLAHRALEADPSIGLLLPCNIVVQSEGETVRVSALDPEMMFAVVDPETQAKLTGLPEEVKSRLLAALAALTET